MNELITLAASEDVTKYPVAGFELGKLPFVPTRVSIWSSMTLPIRTKDIVIVLVLTSTAWHIAHCVDAHGSRQ